MIDIKSESVISLAEAPRHLPRRPDGKPRHLSTLYRWMTTGVRGVVLETCMVGGTRCTSIEALQRFSEAISRQGRPGIPVTPKDRRRQRQADIHRARAKLAAAGIGR